VTFHFTLNTENGVLQWEIGVTSSVMIGLLSWRCQVHVRIVSQLRRDYVLGKAQVRFKSFSLRLRVTFESLRVITSIRIRDNTQEKMVALKLYPDTKFWRFKFSILENKGKGVVMWVKDPSWFMLCSNVCLRCTYLIKEEIEGIHLWSEEWYYKGRHRYQVSHDVICTPYAMLAKW